MGVFFSFTLQSIPYGCAFRATGVFNFAFAAEAYAAAVLYAQLCTDGVNRTVAAALVVLVIAPLFGALLDLAFFSRVPPGNHTAKIVMALGLMVILPQIVQTAVPSTPLAERSMTDA